MVAASTSFSSAMSKRTSTAVRLATAAIALSAANAAVYNVSPDGEPMTLTAALDVAGPGDTISLADGVYREPIVTTQGGEEGSPLTIEGGRGAVINYFSGDKSIMWSQKVVDIKHSWITLRGFTVDGQLVDKGGDEEEDDFVDKCIWVESLEPAKMVTYAGKEVETAIIGTVIEDMKIHNCGMECIRMRNFVTNSVIQNNEISDCGIYDFRFQFDSVIGEAIYIGTSSNQWCSDRVQEVRDICTGPDGSSYNLVKGNKIKPRGNECVDIKEGASFNVVEDNDCSDQRDEESGCWDSRGNDNTFRYNKSDMCEGAGVRLGGHEVDGVVYGTYNHVYGNVFNGAGYGSIKAMKDPQGTICGNSCESGECEIKESGDGEISDSWDQECTGDMPYVPFIDDGDLPTKGRTEVPSPTPEPVDATPKPVAAPTPSEPATPTPKPVAAPTPSDLPEYEALGCFTDKKNSGRIMKYKLHDSSLTTESCALECEGYAFFGTQYGVECWCGGDSTDHLQHGESEVCDYGCAGDDSQTCGGKWAMTVYKYSTAGQAEDSVDTGDDGDDDIECDGVLSNLGYYCCASSCGACGGPSCGSRDGGSKGCCTNTIKESKKMCSTTGGAAPCIVGDYLG